MRSRQASQRLRALIFERDKGTCAACKADCEKIKRVFWAILDYDAQLFYAKTLRVSDHGRTFWDADHIIPFSEGGSDSPPNLQTLCVSCHIQKTAEWQRSRTRQPAKKPIQALVLAEPQEIIVAEYVPPQLPRPNAADADWGNEYYRYHRTQYAIDFVNHYIATRVVENGGYWPRTMEPIESDHADPWIYH